MQIYHPLLINPGSEAELKRWLIYTLHGSRLTPDKWQESVVYKKKPASNKGVIASNKVCGIIK